MTGPVRVLRRLPLTAAALLVGDAVYEHTSVRGDVAPELHPLVRRFLHELPVYQVERYAGWCAEAVLVSDRLYDAERAAGGGALGAGAARAALWGAQLSLCLIREAGDPAHGRPMSPCRSCAALLEWLGVDVVGLDAAGVDVVGLDAGGLDVGRSAVRGSVGDASTAAGESHVDGADGRFPAQVHRVLVDGGWRPGRDGRPGAQAWALELAGYAAPDGRQHRVVAPAMAGYAEFGAVAVTGGAGGEQVARASFVLDPRLGLHAVVLLAELGELLGVALTPLGAEGGGTGLLAIDERGRMFLLDHTADWYLGADLDEALGTLILGRLPARLRDDGGWT